MKNKFLKFAFFGAVMGSMPLMSQAQMTSMSANELAAISGQSLGQSYMINVGQVAHFQVPGLSQINVQVGPVNVGMVSSMVQSSFPVPVNNARSAGLYLVNAKVLTPINMVVSSKVPFVGGMITPISITYMVP
jgi:hypothetical protein